MILIIDYGLGNPNSIKNMLRKSGTTNVLISSKKEDILQADKLVLPGVGNFDYGMAKLKEYNLLETLNKKVQVDKIPILGICLGAQLLTLKSEEGITPGLGWINAETTKFNFTSKNENTKIPHMGWNNVYQSKDSRLLENMPLDSRFYFVHSYHIECHDKEDVLLQSTYGYSFTAAIEHDNIVGVQFHPEKSHKFGMALMNNFINNY